MKASLHPLRRTSDEELSQISGMSVPHYEYVGFDTFPRKDTNKQPTGVPDNDLPAGLDIWDMFTSSYDSKNHLKVWKVVLAAGIGMGLGIFLAQQKVPDYVSKWIMLPGSLFINALKCLIVPMVFCSVVNCMGELLAAGKAAAIGARTVISFTLSSLTSSSLGVIFGIMFSPLFKGQTTEIKVHVPTEFTFKCPSGNYLSQPVNGPLQCLTSNGTNPEVYFMVEDFAGYFVNGQKSFEELSVSDQVFGILFDLIPSNIIAAFADGSTLSVISFALMFGIAVVRSFDCNACKDNYALLLVSQVNIIFRMLINIVITYIPIAIISLIAGSIPRYSSSTDLLQSVGYLILVLGAALLTLVFGIMGTMMFITTRRNILSYLKYIVPAQVFIFGCPSSIATLPMTMRCVDSTREVSQALSRFVLSVGASSNLNGTAVYMTLACIFLARVGGYEDQLTPVTYVMLALVGAIASFGVAPVPHSGLVMVITVWRTVFGADVPPAFSLLVGADWILNRMRAIVNITNDTIIARIIADQCDETTLHELNDYDDEEELCTPPSNSP